MTDVVSAIEESRRGALVAFESGERLWFGRAALCEYPALAAGMEVDLDELRRWLLPRQYAEALNDAVRLLAARARAGGEIRKALTDRRYMDDTVEMVLFKLEKEKLLDDEAFAREWAASRARRQIGRNRIFMELVHKGISRELAESAIADLDGDEGADAAAALAEKLLRRYGYESRGAADKLMAAMARRGYGYDDARRAVETALERARQEE